MSTLKQCVVGVCFALAFSSTGFANSGCSAELDAWNQAEANALEVKAAWLNGNASYGQLATAEAQADAANSAYTSCLSEVIWIDP